MPKDRLGWYGMVAPLGGDWEAHVGRLGQEPSPRALCPQGPPHKPQINTDVLELLTSNPAAPPYPHLAPQA